MAAPGQGDDSSYKYRETITEYSDPKNFSLPTKTVEYSYNGFGEMTDLVRNRDDLYKKFQFEYDILGRPVKSTDSSGEVSESAYEPFCVGQSTTSARGIRRKSSFDSRCLLAEVEVGDPHADPDDLLSVEDPRVRYNFEYDELGRLTRKAERKSVYGSARIGTGLHQTVEEFEYDELDRLVRISRSERSEFGEARFGGIYLNGPNTFRFEYDPEGNLSKKVDPEGNVTEYTYYRDGLLKDVIVKRLSQSDRIFTYEYDDAGRLDKLSYPTSTDVEVLFRDEADLTPTGIGTGFDGNGNLRFMRYQNTNGTLLRRFEYTYDDSNNRISLLDVDPSKAVKWEYGYDWLDRLVSVKRAEAVDVSSLPATTLQRTYVFDESDNRKFFDDHVNGVTYHYKYKSVNKQIPVYTQEELRQLILPWIDQNLSQFIDDIEDILQDTIEDYTGQTTQELQDYASNDLNGFVEMLEYAANQRVEDIYEDDFQQFNQVTFHSDLLDEILVYDTAAGHRTVGDFVLFESFEHDADGNMTKRTLAGTGDETDHTWSDFDRLVKVEKTSGAQTDTLQEALYDSDGLRFRKTDKNGNSSVEHGIGITTSASIPGPGTSAAPTISYIQGHVILGAEINDGTSSEFVYHLPDALGSTRDVIDESGNIVRTFEFDEYGNLLSSSGSGAATPKTWIGGLSVNDDTADSGMFNMGHRNYAGGVLGRFISRDPIGFAGSSMNLYAYPTNPVKYSDPSGLRFFLFGSKTAVSHFEYLIEEATGYDISINEAREVSINSYRGGGSASARRILNEVIEQDACTKIRAQGQERGRFMPNFGLFKSDQYPELNLHEIYLRPHRLLKASAGAPYAYGSVFHEIAEAGHAARTGEGYSPSHAVGNRAQANVLADFGIMTLGTDTNFYMEGGRVYKINRQAGVGKMPGERRPHIHTKSVTKTCVFP